jgi:hypothetical protein
MTFALIHFALNLNLLEHLQYYHAFHIVHIHLIEFFWQMQDKVNLFISILFNIKNSYLVYYLHRIVSKGL